MTDVALLLALSVGATLGSLDISRHHHAWRERAKRMIEATALATKGSRPFENASDANNAATVTITTIGLAAFVGGYMGVLLGVSATSGLVGAVGLALAYVALRDAAARRAQRIEEAAVGGPAPASLRYATTIGALGAAIGGVAILGALELLAR